MGRMRLPFIKIMKRDWAFEKAWESDKCEEQRGNMCEELLVILIDKTRVK